MKSSLEHPFGFFDWYLEEEIYKDLKVFYTDITEELYYNNSDIIDKKNHIVKVLNIYHEDEFDSKYLTFTFEGSIKKKFNSELKNTIDFIELGIQNRFSDKSEVIAFTNFLRIKISSLRDKKSFKDFLFLANHFDKIETLINKYSIQKPVYSFIPSFSILPKNNKDQQQIIDELFKLLTKSPALINCSKEEFTKGFSGQELDDGIQWLVLGKNKQGSNKVSLFYFIDSLINNGFLDTSILTDLLKYVRYTFRNNNGGQLENLKQSRNTISKNPSQKQRIDEIISLL